MNKKEIFDETTDCWRKACGKFVDFVRKTYFPPAYLDVEIFSLKSDINTALYMMDSKDIPMRVALDSSFEEFVSFKKNCKGFQSAKKDIEYAFSLWGTRGLMYIDILSQKDPDGLKRLHDFLLKYKTLELL